MFKAYPQTSKVSRAKYVGNVRVALNAFNPPLVAPVRDPVTGGPQTAADGSLVTHPVQVIVAGQIEMLDEEGALYDRVNIDAAGGMPPKVAKAVANLLQAVIEAFTAAHPDIESTVPPKHASRVTQGERSIERENDRLRKQKVQREAHAARLEAAQARRAAATGAARDGVTQEPTTNPNRK